MTTSPALFNLLQACSLVAMSAGILHAEVVDHHGTQVESESGYQLCLSCHDGVIAANISPCLAQVCPLKSDHPVDRSYPPPDRMREFASSGAAEMAGIKLVDGKVDCISCHNLRNAGRFHLRVADTNSRLCLACHLR